MFIGWFSSCFIYNFLLPAALTLWLCFVMITHAILAYQLLLVQPSVWFS